MASLPKPISSIEGRSENSLVSVVVHNCGTPIPEDLQAATLFEPIPGGGTETQPVIP